MSDQEGQVRLDLDEVAGLLDQSLMHLLTVLARLLLPSEHSALVQAEGRHDGLRRTAKRQEGDDDHEERMRLLQIKQRCALGSGESAPTGLADITALLLALDTDVAGSDESP